MEHLKLLGERLRAFRKRAGLSQLELELSIEASPGSISRIENGEVNPTKETLRKISESLKLTEREKSYIFGELFSPATNEEIERIIQEVKPYFETKGIFAYLTDDRYRFIGVSHSFQKVLNVPNSIVKEAFLRSIIQVFLGPKFGIRALIDGKHFLEVARNLIVRFYSDTHFMEDDQNILDAIQFINSDPILKSLLEEAKQLDPLKYHSRESRIVKLNIPGVALSFVYSDEYLVSNRRFDMVDYTPTSDLAKLISKLI